MKKINVTIFMSLLILAFFSCRQKESMKNYIEKGFSKPTIGDGNIVEFKSVGNGGKVYVPSEKEIEVQFAITNKYSIEITGKIEIPEDKKSLFNKEPEIKELTPTKMVIAFNFNEDAEPKDVNKFLGESVGITAKIFEKGTGRFLSSQELTANCNTPPEKIDTITYNEADDKYTVVLPRNGGGVHNDLKKVEFILSSAGNDEKKTFSIDIEDASQQGQTIDLPVKGNGERQLKNPSGQRKIEVTVYDKASLKSDESKNETERIFTSITLLPHEKSVSVKKAKEGFPIPEIKELKDFFDGDDWKKAGYTVECSASNPVGFVYDEASKVLKHPNPKVTSPTEPAYTIKVILKQGALHPPVDATFTIKIVDNTNVDIDIDNLKITDITDYSSRQPPLLFNNPIVFVNDGGVLTADVQVPYTSFDTKLKVQVQAVNEETQGKDEGPGGANWSNPSYKKEYEIVIGNLPANSRKEINFSIASKDSSTVKKTYKIIFQCQEPVAVTMIFEKNKLPNGKTAKVVASWAYKSEEFSFTVGDENEKYIIVGQDQEITINITVGEGVRVEKCTSNLTGTPTYPIPGAGGKIKITASISFELVIKIRPDALLVDWYDCRHKFQNEITCGYDKGKIIYTKPNKNDPEEDELDADDDKKGTKRLVKDNTPVTLKIEGLHTTHYVDHWVVNGELVEAGSEFSLSDNECELTILEAKTDYEVQVTVRKKALTLTASFDKDKAENGHGYTFNVTYLTGGYNPPPNTSTTPGKFTYGLHASHKVKIEAMPPSGRKAKYGVKEWQKLKDDGVNWETIQDSQNKTSIELIMDNNKEVRAVLLPQYTFTLAPKLDANAGKLTIANKNAEILSTGDILAEMLVSDNQKSKTITYDGSSLYFKVTGLSTDNLVVSCKRKAFDGSEQEMTSLFDTDTGMWKEKGSLNLDPGDEFVVEIARVRRIRFSVVENDTAYTGFTKIRISKTGSVKDEILFPIPTAATYNAVEITPENIGTAAIYITKNTELQICTTLPSEKEIAIWQNFSGNVLGNTFNKNYDKPLSRYGYQNVNYIHNGRDYSDLNLKAVIRDKTKDVTIKIQDFYRENTPFKDLEDTGGVKVEVKRKDGRLITKLDANEYKCEMRLKPGEEIKLEATQGDTYRFAFWKARKMSGGYPSDFILPNGYSHNLKNGTYKLPNEENNVSEVIITVSFTKHLIAVMHKSTDANVSSNLPSSIFTGQIHDDKRWGWSYLWAYEGSSKIANCRDMRNFSGGKAHIFNKGEGTTALEDNDFLIKDLNGKYIDLVFKKPTNSNYNNQKVVWKYHTEDNETGAYRTDKPTDTGSPEQDGKTKVKLKDLNFLKNAGVLHLWLYKVE